MSTQLGEEKIKNCRDVKSILTDTYTGRRGEKQTGVQYLVRISTFQGCLVELTC